MIGTPPDLRGQPIWEVPVKGINVRGEQTCLRHCADLGDKTQPVALSLGRVPVRSNDRAGYDFHLFLLEKIDGGPASMV